MTCNTRKDRVVGFLLPGVGLRGSIPENRIAKLDAPRILSLHSNGLSGNLPSDILSIPSLQFLFLQHSFSGLLPSSFSPRLIALDLSFNSFSSSIPPGLQKLERLTWLYLQNNSFSGAIPDFNLPRPRFLNLSYNNLNGLVPNSIQKFPCNSFVGNSLLCGRLSIIALQYPLLHLPPLITCHPLLQAIRKLTPQRTDLAYFPCLLL